MKLTTISPLFIRFQVAKAKIIVGDPSYFHSSKSRVVGKVVRSICILDHPVVNTDNAESVQIIIPASQVKRHNDIYVCMVSFAHNVAAAGRYIAIVSTTVETSNPIAELEAGFKILGTIMERLEHHFPPYLAYGAHVVPSFFCMLIVHLV
jgi:Rab GDP dissociation inhibitor